MRRRILVPYGILTFLTVVGCTESATVVTTIPEHGATGVATTSNVQVFFSAPMDQASLENSSNYEVTGSLSGIVSIAPSYNADLRSVTLNPSPPTGATDIFALGEFVVVRLSNKLKAASGIPFDRRSFSFTIIGTASDPADDESAAETFRVTATNPEPHSTAASRRPTVRVHFEKAVRTSTISANVRLRGEISGRRQGFVDFGTLEDGSQDATELIYNPSDHEPFFPGEQVFMSLSRGILSDPAADLGDNEEGEGTSGDLAPEVLRPFVFGFEIPNGELLGSFLAPRPITDLESVTDLVVGEYTEVHSGLELAVLDRNQGLRILRNSFQTVASTTDVAGGDPVAIVTPDWDDDGHLDLVVATRNPSQLVFLRIEAERLVVENDSDGFPLIFSLPAEPVDLLSGDFDGDLLVDFAVATSAGVHRVSQRQVIDITQVPPVTNRVLNLEEKRVSDLPALAIAGADFDEDGRLDFVTSTDSALQVLRNTGGFNFVFASTLDSALVTDPLILEAGDREGDGDADILTVGAGGVIVYQNPGATIPTPTWSPHEIPLPEGNPDAARIADLDGDGDRDLITYVSSSGELTLHFDSTDTGPYQSFHRFPIPGMVSAPGIALGDIAGNGPSGDGGTDVLLFGDQPGGRGIYLSEPSKVIDVAPSPFAFQVPAVLERDISAAEFEVTVSADLSEPITSFTVALEFEANGLELVSIRPDPTAFPTSGDIAFEEVVVDNEEGRGVGRGNLVTPRDGSTQLAVFVFRLDGAPGTFSYELTNGSAEPNRVVGVNSGTVLADITSEGSGVLVITAAVDSVSGLECHLASDGAIDLSWQNPEVYSEIDIDRNGAPLFTLPGSATSFSDPTPPGGGVTYEVTGRQESQQSVGVECEVNVIPPVTDLQCERDLNDASRVRLEWTPPIAFNRFEITRDGNFRGISLQASFIDTLENEAVDHGHLYEVTTVQNQERSVPVPCAIGDVDSGSQVTASPRNVRLVIPPLGNDADLSWENGENYHTVRVERFVRVVGGSQFTEDGKVLLVGNTTSLNGDPLSRELLPGTYFFQVTGIIGAVESDSVGSGEQVASLPAPSKLSCQVSGGNDVELGWVNGVTGPPDSFHYDDVTVWRDGVLVATQPGTAETYVDLDVVDGSPTYTVRGAFQTIESAESNSCQVSIANRIRIEDLTSAPGVDLDAIEVRAEVLDSLEGFAFTLEYDGDAFQLFRRTDDNNQIVVELGSGADCDRFAGALVTAPDVATGNGTIRRVTVAVSNVSVCAGQAVTLVRLPGIVPDNFDLVAAGGFPLEITNGTFTRDSDSLTFDVAELIDGTLTVVGNALLLYDDIVMSGQEELVVPVDATFAGQLAGYTVILEFDPVVLEFESVTTDGTVAPITDDLCLFTNQPPEPGFAHASAFIFAPGLCPGQPLPPQVGARILYFRFRVLEPFPTTSTLIGFGEVDPIGPSTLVSDGALSNHCAPGSGELVCQTYGAEITFQARPAAAQLDGIVPGEGPLAGGGNVVLAGSGFDVDGANVFFGSMPAAIVDPSDTELVVTVPPSGSGGPGAVDLAVEVKVVYPGGESNGLAYTYRALSVSSLSPSSGDVLGGESVTLHGHGFTDEDTVVRFGEGDAVVGIASDDGTALSVTTPPAAVSGPVTVTIELADAQTVTVRDAFTYTSPQMVPMLTGVTPRTGPTAGGTTVTLQGTNFDDSLAVVFGGAPVTPFVMGADAAMVTTPGSAAGSVDVTVMNGAGSDTLTGAFVYELLGLTTVSPTVISSCGGGVEVTVVGEGMADGLAIRFGGIPATDVTVFDGGHQATCLTPPVPQGTGTVGIELENPDGQLVGAADAITFGEAFIRGDADGNGTVELADVTFIASVISQIASPPFPDAADVDDDGLYTIGDVVYLANYLNASGTPPPPPFPDPGFDPTPDPLGNCD